MAKRKRFTLEDYEAIKKLLEDNRIDNKKLAQYAVFKRLRHQRHRKEINCTDEEIEAYVNQEITMEMIEKRNEIRGE